MQARTHIGINVRALREAAGLSQHRLAEMLTTAVGRTTTYDRSYISHIETGRRAIATRELLLAFSRVLEVDVHELLGQPYAPLNQVDLDPYQVVPLVRAALVDPDDPITPRPVETLTELAEHAMIARMGCDWAALGRTLPGLLADTRTGWLDSDEHLTALFVRAAVTASLAFKPAGWYDLSVRLAEQAEQAAVWLGEPVAIAAARFAVAQTALAAGATRRSYTLAAKAAATVPTTTPDGIAWAGMLHLHAALSAAARRDPDTANGHVNTAADLARHVQGNPWRMEFTTANVNTWRVGIALDLGDPGRAPELAAAVNPTELHVPERKARLHLDTARGMYEVGDHDGATTQLLAADAVDPTVGYLRHRSTAVNIVAALVQDAPTRGGSRQLAELARRTGVHTAA